MDIEITSPEEQEMRKLLLQRSDPEAKRLLRFLDLPDLSRQKGSPLKEIVDRTRSVKSLEGFDVIKIPEIVSVPILFDMFNMPPSHPARSASDTYYINKEYVLRTHDTVFWYYYLNHPAIKERIKKNEAFGTICFGKVYRKDEIDRKHMNVFHQIGGLYLAPDEKKTVTPEDLKNVLSDIVRNIFSSGVQFRFYEHTFPYTDPSFEMEVEIGGQWIEMLGSGLPRKSVLANFGLTGYNGWAFGFGLERLAMVSMKLPDIRLLWSDDKRVRRQLKLGHTYVPVSKYPAIARDISFVVGKDFVPNNYFDLIRDAGGDLIEEVQLIDKYEDAEKFGPDKVSYTYRIVYRSNERTLVSGEIDKIQRGIYGQTAEQFNAKLR